MKIYDGNFINLKVNDKKFMNGEKTNDEICLNDDSILAGKNIVVEKLESGKIRISVLGATEPDIPFDNLYFTTRNVGIFRMYVGLQEIGSVNIYYKYSSKYITEKNIPTDGREITKLFKKSNNRKSYIDDTGNPIILFKCNEMGLNSLSLINNAALKILDVKDNNLYYLDLTQNTNLEYVDISNNPISEIVCSSLFLDSFIAKNCSLESITLYGLSIDTLDLSDNNNLTELNINTSGVKNLNLTGTSIKEISISDFALIESLILDNSSIERISLIECNNLENLSFDNCQVNYFYAGGFSLTSEDVILILRTIYNSNVYNGTLIIDSSGEYETDVEILSLEEILRFRGWFVRIGEASDSVSVSESESYSDSESYSESESESVSDSESVSESESESGSESESYSDIDVFVPRIIEYNNVSGKVVVIPQILVNGVYVDDPDREPVEVDF